MDDIIKDIELMKEIYGDDVIIKVCLDCGQQL